MSQFDRKYLIDYFRRLILSSVTSIVSKTILEEKICILDIVAPIIESIKPKHGIGSVVLLSFLPFTAWLAFFAIAKRLSKIKLAYIIKVRLNGQLNVGSAAVWGTIIGLFGLGLLGVYFSIDVHDRGDKILLWLVVVPLILTGLFLLLFQVMNNQLPAKIDILLKDAWLNKKIEPTKSLVNKNIQVTKYDVFNLMSEFEHYKVLQFHIDDNGDYIIDGFHHIVEHYFMEHPVQFNVEDSCNWICKGCGATNNMHECEYCGNTKPN